MTVPATRGAPCARCRCELAPEDLRCAVCGLPSPERAEAVPERALAQILRCEACGAAISYDASIGAPKCAFCGAVMHLEAPVDPVEHADAWLPFTIQAEHATRALDAFLSRRRFLRPSGLAAEAKVTGLKPLWWVAWIFDADAEVTWTADSDQGSRKSAWAPHAGSGTLHLERELISASRGLTEDETAALASSFRLEEARSGAPSGVEGAVVERFDVQRSAARERITLAIEAQALEQAKDHWIPGSRKRNVHTAVRITGLKTERYALPSWVLAWRYRGKVHRAVISGQDATRVVGKVPFSPWKVVGFVTGLTVAVAALVAAAVHLLG